MTFRDLIDRLFPARSVRREEAREQEFETRVKERLRQLAVAKEAALISGGGRVHPWQNVAHGTPGWALFACEFDGLMTKKSRYERIDPISSGYVTYFELTAAGKRAKAMLADDPA